MLEVELKAHLDPETYKNIPGFLKELGAVFTGELRESDHYYNSGNKDRDFRITDEALRIRETSDTKTIKAFLTYKGPKSDTRSKTRMEHEVGILNAQTMAEILEKLGFKAVLTVSKSRCIYSLQDIDICLDNVDGLGTFMELEIMKEDEADREKALDEMFTLMEKLQIPESALERKSYLEMLLDSIMK